MLHFYIYSEISYSFNISLEKLFDLKQKNLISDYLYHPVNHFENKNQIKNKHHS